LCRDGLVDWIIARCWAHTNTGWQKHQTCRSHFASSWLLSLTPLVQEKWAAEIGVTSEGQPDFVKLVKIVNGSCIPVCSHPLLSLDVASSLPLALAIFIKPLPLALAIFIKPSIANLEHACTRTLSMTVLILYDALIYALRLSHLLCMRNLVPYHLPYRMTPCRRQDRSAEVFECSFHMNTQKHAAHISLPLLCFA